MVVFINGELNSMEAKRVKIYKRQINIPKAFYDKLRLGEEAECIFDENKGEIIIRPYIKEDYFSEYILADLISKGLSGRALQDEFVKMKNKVRPAVERVIVEADKVAAQLKDSGDDEMREIFADMEE